LAMQEANHILNARVIKLRAFIEASVSRITTDKYRANTSGIQCP
jgi:hypothetical protein